MSMPAFFYRRPPLTAAAKHPQSTTLADRLHEFTGLLLLAIILLLSLSVSTAQASDCSAPAADSAPVLALIIDDLGYQASTVKQLMALQPCLTLSFLPSAPYSTKMARQASAAGQEVMLHLPMQAHNDHQHYPLSLRSGASFANIARTLEQALRAVPGARGINNHRGSLLTEDRQEMNRLMQALKKYGSLYFVDSRTSKYTVAEKSARSQGIAAARRRVFLDNEQNIAAIDKQFDQLIKQARKRGHAIGIAHPYPQTLQVLAQRLPQLQQAGIVLLPVSQLIKTQTDRRTAAWQASLSHSHKVAKNSKPSLSSTCCAEPILKSPAPHLMSSP